MPTRPFDPLAKARDGGSRHQPPVDAAAPADAPALRMPAWSEPMARRAPLRVLLVEDDPDFGSALLDGLGLEGHTVGWLQRGQPVEAALRSNHFDAVLLDLGLPDVDGHVLLRAMRQRHDATPVIVFSASCQPNDRIEVLDLGADDYLVKPIDLEELDARLHAVTRRCRNGGDPAAAAVHGALQLDASGAVYWQGRRMALRERERSLLELLLGDRERTFTRRQIEAALYRDGATVDSNAVEVYVHFLRRKITADVIVTVRGLGYRLGPPPH